MSRARPRRPEKSGRAVNQGYRPSLSPCTLWLSRSRNIEPERVAFHGGVAGADGLDRAHHATLPLEQPVGNRDDRYVRLRGARGAPDVPGDLLLVARRIE